MTQGTVLHHPIVRNDRGAVAVIVAIVLPVLLGVAALAVDVSLYRVMQNKMQSAADAGALAGVKTLDEQAAVVAQAIAMVMLNVPESYGAVTMADDVELGIYDPETRSFVAAVGENVNAVRVSTVRSSARGNAPPRLLSRVLGDEAIDIRASAIAARQIQLQYEPPEVVDLAPDAGDFNETYAYCFDYRGSGSPETRRSQMTLIANNDPTGAAVAASNGVVSPVPSAITWPKCGNGQSLSFLTRNIRHAKSMPQLWSDPDASICISNCGKKKAVYRQIGRTEFNYYTDTVINNGVEEFNLSQNILERIRCDSQNCEQELADGTIPLNSKNRSPILDTRPCVPGKYVYFGWEDRPPSAQGQSGHWTDPNWTDTDYDDIRMVLRCPSTGMLGDGIARLVR